MPTGYQFDIRERCRYHRAIWKMVSEYPKKLKLWQANSRLGKINRSQGLSTVFSIPNSAARLLDKFATCLR